MAPAGYGLPRMGGATDKGGGAVGSAVVSCAASVRERSEYTIALAAAGGAAAATDGASIGADGTCGNTDLRATLGVDLTIDALKAAVASARRDSFEGDFHQSAPKRCRHHARTSALVGDIVGLIAGGNAVACPMTACWERRSSACKHEFASRARGTRPAAEAGTVDPIHLGFWCRRRARTAGTGRRGQAVGKPAARERAYMHGVGACGGGTHRVVSHPRRIYRHCDRLQLERAALRTNP